MLSGSRLTLSCVSYSKRTDLVPRHRAFQATTLLDIAQQVAKTEPLFKILNPGDLSKPIPLSLQYLETDYQYLSRMLHAWGVPLAVVDRTGEVNLGARGQEASEVFPDVNFGWAEISFLGSLHALPQAPGGGSGPTGLARQQLNTHLQQLTRKTAEYMQAPERPDIMGHATNIKGHNDVSGYYLRLEGLVLPFQPGQVVIFEEQQHLIHRTRIVGHPDQTTATQEFWLQPLTLPLPPERERPHWPSRAVWGNVTANEHDPLQQGRIQVEFEWEHLDPQPGSDRAWLHLLTPYGGGHDGGKKASAYSGFYSVPEVGERVLVEFLGDWDSEAVILGTMRHVGQKTTFNPKDTKRWATPSGNEVTMTTKDGQDVVRIRARNQMILDAHVSGGKHVSLMCHGSEDDSLQIDVADQAGTFVRLKGSNDMLIYTKRNLEVTGDHDVTVHAGNNMLIKAQNNLTLESSTMHLHANHLLVEAADHLHMQGTTAQVQSGPGQVHVDGPTVMINVSPLPKPTFKEDVGKATG